MRHRRGRVAGLAAGLVVAVASTATVPPPAVASVDLGPFAGPVRFEAPDGVVLDTGDRRYAGTLEATVDADGGMTVVDELSTDAYLEGVAEVPVSWPDEALRAQVIAARTYAWWELRQGAWAEAGFDLCGTQACQVFAGRDVVEQDPTGRWAAAVAATSGEVLVDDRGDPLLARYSSSNGGRSIANVERFPDDGDLPHLQPVDDPFDEVSPWHRWQVRFPWDDLDAILARGQRLSAAVPVAEVGLEPIAGGPDEVVVTGRDGTEVAVGVDEFRFFVTRTAPDVAPDRYPPAGPDGDRLPTTLLSSQLTFTASDEGLVVDGRGFGHGVGMGQYGALGRARAGQDHRQILAAYYGGVTPVVADDLPTTLRVGVAQDAEELRVRLPSPVPVVVGDTVLTERGLGTWQVRPRADGTLQVVAPEGFGAPLVVAPTVAGVDRVSPTGVVRLGTVVNKPVELVVEVRDAAGQVLRTTSAGVVDAGRHEVDWSVAGDGGGSGVVADGQVEVALVGVDEQGERAGAPTTVTVTTTDTAAPTPGPTTAPAWESWRWPASVAAVVALAGGVLVVLRRRAGRR